MEIIIDICIVLRVSGCKHTKKVSGKYQVFPEQRNWQRANN